MILGGKFRWFFRRRLRISLTGDPAKITLPPVELKEQQLQYPEYRYMDLMNETDCDHPFKVGGMKTWISLKITVQSGI